MAELDPIILYMHGAGPTPWKVAIILEELGLPYTKQQVELSEIKKEPYISINPNGRVPSIYDPNKNITLWEVRKTSTNASLYQNINLIRMPDGSSLGL